MEINMKDLEEMSALSFEDVRMEDVPAFGNIRPDMSLSPEERVEKMMASGKNPYFRKTRDGKVLVKISFANNGVKLADALASALASPA